jgi:hypothetical protein
LNEPKSTQLVFLTSSDLLKYDQPPPSTTNHKLTMPHVLSPADLAKKAERLAKKQAAQAAKLAAAAQDPSSSSSSSSGFEVSSPAGSAGILKRNWLDLDEVEGSENGKKGKDGEVRVKIATWNMLAQTLVRKSPQTYIILSLRFFRFAFG